MSGVSDADSKEGCATEMWNKFLLERSTFKGNKTTQSQCASLCDTEYAYYGLINGSELQLLL